MEKIILTQPNSKGKIKFLEIALEGIGIKKSWGVVGGKVQTAASEYKPKNVGKKNEVTAEQSAKAEFDKVVKKKVKEGYVITESLEELPEFNDPLENLDLNNIPTGFCCSKPTASITEAEIDELIASGSSRTFVKYNGGCHYILTKENNEVQIFTRRWDEHTTKYPTVAKAIQEKAFPAGTLIIAELCVDPLLGMPHMEAFKALSKISKTDTLDGKCKPSQVASIALQKEYPVRVAVYGFLYFGGKNVCHVVYDEQMNQIQRVIESLNSKGILFYPQEVEVASGAALLALAKKQKKALEGFIIWQSNEAMEISMNGKPKRKACWKVKVKEDMEVIAFRGIEGKVPGEFGSIGICRYDSKGNPVDMGKAQGLKTDERDPSYWEFPVVVEVEGANIQPGTGKLQFPNLVQIHFDKDTSEVPLFSLD